MRCARRDWERYFVREKVTLDGVVMDPIGYEVATAAFSFTMPSRDNYLGVAHRTGGRAAVYAGVDILTPLTPGAHTLAVEARFVGGPASKTTYELAVR